MKQLLKRTTKRRIAKKLFIVTESSSLERIQYEPDSNNINKMCRLLKCEYFEINPDDVGRIVDIIEDGYWIEFTKNFKNYPSNNYIKETRTIFGLAKNTVLL